MKKLIYNVNNYLLLVLLAAVAILLQPGCKKDSSSGAPVITSIRNYVAHPGDSLLSKVGTGQWVVISGHNLKGVLQIYFDGVEGSFNDVYNSDTSAIALIPAVIAFPSVPAKQLNTIQYITTHGQTTFSFSIVAPAPQITGFSDEDANPGDSVKIIGFNFFFISNLSFAGKTITGYNASNDGTTITLAVPPGIPQTGGPVSITTKSGTVTTVYNVEDFVDGVLQNYDNVSNFSFGSGSSNDATAYPGNTGYYGIISSSSLGPYDYGWYNYPRSINTNGAQWVPVDSLSSAVGNYAVKFEISVTTPWTGGSIYILKDYSSTYQALYRPWKLSNGSTTAFTTKGWTTITIPLSNFVDSNGLPPASLTTLLGSGGNGAINFWFENDSGNSIAAFEAAFDNIRVVRIK